MAYKPCKPTFICDYFILRFTGNILFLETTSNFRDQNIVYLENIIPETFQDMFAAIVICDDKALENVAKISRKRMKVGL